MNTGDENKGMIIHPWYADKTDTHSWMQVQDKDELTMKKLKTEGGDKEGIKEAEVISIGVHRRLVPTG